jgi:hypothetical protein
MKRIVLGSPIPSLVVCGIATGVMYLTGPDSGAVYFVALAIATIALAFLIAPRDGRRDRPQSASWRRPQ